jgi:hydroxymethylbilane synthase
VSVHAQLEHGMIEIDALVSSPDGQRIVRDSIRGEMGNADEAVDALADRVLSRGGRAILSEIIRS